jgi:hypothetical protein
LFIYISVQHDDRLCGLVVRVPGYRFRGLGFDSRRYQIFCEVVGLERGPLSLETTTEELLGRKSSGSGLESLEYGRRDPPRLLRDTTLSAKVGTSFVDNRAVARRTQTTELFIIIIIIIIQLSFPNWGARLRSD